MARTASTMLPLGTAAPDFALSDVTSGAVNNKLNDFAGRDALLVMFILPALPVCAARAKTASSAGKGLSG